MSATTLQTPVSNTVKAWLKGYKEARGLPTIGDAIEALIDEYDERGDHLDICDEVLRTDADLRAGRFNTLAELIAAN